jgi:hypothetical protein
VCLRWPGSEKAEDFVGEPVVAGVRHAFIWADEHHTTKRDQYPQLQRRDEALSTSAFRAFINMMHKAWLIRLSAGKAHQLVTFLANRLFGQRVWRGHFQGHRVKWEYASAA